MSQEQTGNHSLITAIFIYSINSQWVTNICKAWFWVLAIQKGVGYNISISSPSHLHKKSEKNTDSHSTMSERHHGGPNRDNVPAEKGHLPQRYVCLCSQISEKGNKSLLLLRDAFSSHLSLAFDPLILWSRLFCPLESRYESGPWRAFTLRASRPHLCAQTHFPPSTAPWEWD